MFTYRIHLIAEPEGGFTVLVPILPGCITYGETVAEAKEMAQEAIALYIKTDSRSIQISAKICYHLRESLTVSSAELCVKPLHLFHRKCNPFP